MWYIPTTYTRREESGSLEGRESASYLLKIIGSEAYRRIKRLQMDLRARPKYTFFDGMPGYSEILRLAGLHERTQRGRAENLVLAGARLNRHPTSVS